MTTTVVETKTVMGVKLGKIDQALVRASYKTAMGKQPIALTDETIVRDLMTHFQKLSPKGLMECMDCGGGSPPAMETCPFCGAEDDDEEDDEVREESKDREVKVEEKSAAPMVKATSNGVAKHTTHAEVVDSTPFDSSKKALDEIVAKIQALKLQGSVALYRLGAEIYDVYDKKLWVQRNDERGKPKYKNFGQWLAEEVDIHRKTAFRMMQVSRDFTAEQAQKFGNTILRGLLAAPKEDRKDLLKKLEAGKIKGARGIDREVKKIRERKGVTTVAGAGKSKRAEKATVAAAAARSAAKKKVVTIAVPAGKKTLKLLVRQLKKDDPEKRAKRIADRPWGKLECQNGASLYLSIVESADGYLEATIEARRDDEE